MNVNASVLPYREESLCFGPESRLIATLTLPVRSVVKSFFKASIARSPFALCSL